MLTQDHQTYHVICHDCSFESLTDSETEASQLADGHRAERDHQTRYARIQ